MISRENIQDYNSDSRTFPSAHPASKHIFVTRYGRQHCVPMPGQRCSSLSRLDWK